MDHSNTKAPLLSICIPTYRRAEFLNRRLEQLQRIIPAEALSKIEVLVSDNGSPDHTPEVVEKYRGVFPNYTTLRHPTNLGADYNFLNCFASAKGDYIWLFGDDDEFLPHAVTYILPYLESGKFTALFPNQRFGESYSCREAFGEQLYSFASDRVHTLEGLCAEFGFVNLLGLISGIIVRRPVVPPMVWCRHQNYETALVHATLIYELYRDEPAVIITEPLLLVEPPLEHQERSHQISQDPRIDFRQWSLNLAGYFTDLSNRGLLRDLSKTNFYSVKYCKISLPEHMLLSFQNCLAEFREIPEGRWQKLQSFLQLLGDRERLTFCERLRTAQGVLLKSIYGARTSPGVVDDTRGQLEQMRMLSDEEFERLMPKGG